MASVTAWRCICGTEIIVAHDSDGVRMTVRCPGFGCQKENDINETISGVWIRRDGILEPFVFSKPRSILHPRTITFDRKTNHIFAMSEVHGPALPPPPGGGRGAQGQHCSGGL